jgi:hypothetical protein
MLEQLRMILKRGGTVTIDQMARELDTTPEVIAGMIDHLVRAGQLRPMNVGCGFACHQCLLVRDCHKPHPDRLWRSGD